MPLDRRPEADYIGYKSGYFAAGKVEPLNIPLKIVGIGLIGFGFYLNDSAKRKSKLFEMVVENKLITTGVYRIVRQR